MTDTTSVAARVPRIRRRPDPSPPPSAAPLPVLLRRVALIRADLADGMAGSGQANRQRLRDAEREASAALLFGAVPTWRRSETPVVEQRSYLGPGVVRGLWDGPDPEAV